MAASSTAKTTHRFKRINDSLWELYAPADGVADFDMVFFHGLQLGDFEDAFWKTWVVKGSDVDIWPSKLLSKEPGFNRSRMFSVSYNSSVMQLDGQLSMYTLGGNLVTDVILGKAQIGQNRPVFLVGHSWGGIVIKQLIISALNRRAILERSQHAFTKDIENITAFLDNFCGVYYYATPHHGSRLADLASKFLPGASPILKYLRTLNDDTEIINNDFEQFRQVPAAAVAEGLDTNYTYFGFGFKGKVVTQASAQSGIDNFYVNTVANHFDVCKAENGNSAVIQKLTGFVNKCLSSVLPTPPSGLPGSSEAGSSSQSDLEKRFEALQRKALISSK